MVPGFAGEFPGKMRRCYAEVNFLGIFLAASLPKVACALLAFAYGLRPKTLGSRAVPIPHRSRSSCAEGWSRGQ